MQIKYFYAIILFLFIAMLLFNQNEIAVSLLFILTIMLIYGINDIKEGKSGLFYLGFFVLMCLMAILLFIGLYFVFNFLNLLPGQI